MFDGKITDKAIEEDYIKLDTYQKIGVKYISAENFVLGNANVYLYIKTLPRFDDVYKYFMVCRDSFLRKNQNQDICLSLFYNPYFTEFCERLKKDISIIPRHKLKFIESHFLDFFADPIQYKAIVEMNLIDESLKNYYLKKNIFNKSQELLQLIKNG